MSSKYRARISGLADSVPRCGRILIPDGHNALLYVYEGSLTVGDHDYRLVAGKMGQLSHQGLLVLRAEPGRFWLSAESRSVNQSFITARS